jgi:hypothetical protein
MGTRPGIISLPFEKLLEIDWNTDYHRDVLLVGSVDPGVFRADGAANSSALSFPKKKASDEAHLIRSSRLVCQSCMKNHP